MFDLMGDGMTFLVTGVQSTELIHDDKQLLGEPTGKSVEIMVRLVFRRHCGKVLDYSSSMRFQ